MSLHDLLIIAAILLASRLALAAVNALARRTRAAAEFSRKLLHVAMGLILTPLPWLFDYPAPVLLLCATYVALLVARRYLVALDNHVGPAIDGVGRQSIGEFLFPIAVALLFHVAHNDRALYLAPLLILTLADAAAAVIGKRYGICPYNTPGGRKTLEGSLAFATVAFASTHLTLLLLVDTGRAESVLIALIVALTLTAVEALASGGWDNLLVPLGAVALLKTLPMFPTHTLALIAAGTLATTLGLTVLYVWLFSPTNYTRAQTPPATASKLAR